MKGALVAVALTLAVLVLIWGGLHVFIRPVNPAQETPKGHFAGTCWACHFVSEGADIIEE